MAGGIQALKPLHFEREWVRVSVATAAARPRGGRVGCEVASDSPYQPRRGGGSFQRDSLARVQTQQLTRLGLGLGLGSGLGLGLGLGFGPEPQQLPLLGLGMGLVLGSRVQTQKPPRLEFGLGSGLG